MYTSWPPQEKLFIWPTFVTRLLTPRSRKFGYGLLLGCRSGLDAGPFQKTFFLTMFELRTQNPGESSPSVLVRHVASQSIGRGRISREGALDVRESRDRRDKIFAEK